MSDAIYGVETSRLLLVDFLLNEGFTLYPLNPKAVDLYRDRYSARQAKSYSLDAEIIAHALRTDRQQFRLLLPDRLILRELRILVQDQQQLNRTKTRFLNQLRACLADYYPAALEFFAELDSTIALAFLKAHPVSLDAQKTL